MSEDKKYLAELLPKLAAKMPFKWRVQSFSKFKPEATCVAYIDARDAQQRLDESCDYGWERDHKEIKGHVYAGVGLVMPSGRMLWRWDCGTESKEDAEKGEASDSFKRACVNFGVSRFLYDLGIKHVTANEKKGDSKFPPKVVDSKGKWVEDLTKHINGDYKAEAKQEKKTEPITIDIIIAFIPTCTTEKSLNDYYNKNKVFINTLYKKEIEEVMEAFKKRKEAIKGGLDSSQGMRN